MKLPSSYLWERIPENNKRYPTFLSAIGLMDKRNAKVIVETGTARFGFINFIGDGGSTVIFAHYANDHEADFFTIDINEENLGMARAAAEPLSSRTHFVLSDSVKFLKTFTQPIDFLYLDSFDFNASDPAPSQTHHLKEIAAAYPLLTEKSAVMIDDCDLAFGGKGKFAIAFLLDRGWRIYEQGYQVILVPRPS